MVQPIPTYTGTLRSHSLTLPACIHECSGIRIFGRLIRSLAFTTDTPQPVIAQAIITVSDVPVFVGVGGGITTGARAVRLAVQAEHQGAHGVVLNAPTPNEVIGQIKERVDLPVVITVVSAHTDIRGRLDAGADILNVSGAGATPDIVADIRQDFPEVPIIATGGPTEESIRRTIQAGANAVTYTPPANGVLFAQLMTRYRQTC